MHHCSKPSHSLRAGEARLCPSDFALSSKARISTLIGEECFAFRRCIRAPSACQRLAEPLSGATSHRQAYPWGGNHHVS